MSSALSGWNAGALREANGNHDGGTGAAVVRQTKTGTFLLSRTEALIAETWEDLGIIEACLQHRRQQERPGQFRFTEDVVSIERCAEDIIKRDGVKRFEASGANARLSNLEEIRRRMGEPPWDYLLVFSQTDQTGMICQRPGESVRKHAHMTHAEWWMVLQGEFEWRFGDGTVVHAKPMELVTAPRGLIHTITCVSDVPGIRLACGARDMEHVYYRP
jgi:mannose-6-phosphate isomerase-like protein (cupin superfamily)